MSEIDALKNKIRADLASLADYLGWEIDERGEPRLPAAVFELADLRAEGLTTLAQVAVRAGAFASVGEAKRNGWNRPLEAGEFEIGRRRFRIR